MNRQRQSVEIVRCLFLLFRKNTKKFLEDYLLSQMSCYTY